MPQKSTVTGIGVDIIELERVRKIKQLRRFAEYFLLPTEIEAFGASADPIGFIASRFAAKEAVIKAFPGKLKPHEFEIIKAGVKPTVRFVSEKTSVKYRALVSLSHSTRYAAGYATVFLA
jgi:phosphopantetheine--protein transferase-like protein